MPLQEGYFPEQPLLCFFRLIQPGMASILSLIEIIFDKEVRFIHKEQENRHCHS
jgi:hypothetical protein